MGLPQPPPARGQGVKLLVEAVAEGEATGGAVVGSPKGVGASAGESSCVLVFKKGREAWKSQSHISAHFAPVELYTRVLPASPAFTRNFPFDPLPSPETQSKV